MRLLPPPMHLQHAMQSGEFGCPIRCNGVIITVFEGYGMDINIAHASFIITRFILVKIELRPKCLVTFLALLKLVFALLGFMSNYWALSHIIAHSLGLQARPDHCEDRNCSLL